MLTTSTTYLTHRADPLLLSCAEHDGAFGTESRRKAIDILQSGNKIYHLQLFQGVSHGFASRGDLDNPYESEFRSEIYIKSLHQYHRMMSIR